MGTAFDPEQAVQTGLLGAAGPVQVTVGPHSASVDYFDYTKKDGTVAGRTVAALVPMYADGDVDEQGKPRTYIQMYSVGDPKSHSPNAEKTGFDGPLVKGSNFNFFLENLINAGFPKHLLKPGDIRVLNGAVIVVEQKKPPARQIQGSTTEQANKAIVVPVKVIHPAPGEDWPATGKPVTAAAQAGAKKPGQVGGTKKAQVPQTPQTPAPATQAAPTPAAPSGGTDADISSIATSLINKLISGAGELGYMAKDAEGTLKKIGKDATLAYLKSMQSDAANFPSAARNEVLQLCQSVEWLFNAERPWVGDESSGLLVGN